MLGLKLVPDQTDRVIVRSTGAWQFFCFVLFFALMGQFKEPIRVPASSRAPASVSADCFASIKSFLGKRPMITRAWSRLKKIKGGYKLDYELLERYRAEYEVLLERQGILELRDINKNSSEGLLAYIEVLNKQLGGEHIPEMKNMNVFRRKKVAAIVEKLNSKGGMLFDDLENLMGDLYIAAYGPSMRADQVLFEDDIEKMVLARVIQEDMASRGLMHMFPKYRLLNKKKTWAQKFTRSKLGRTLGVSIMNLGVIWGLPPIYLPKLRPIKIPEHMVQEILENGLTKEVVNKLEQEIGRQLGDKMTFNLSNRARYRLFRRYFMAGMGAYLTYMMMMELYETNSALNEEAEVLQEAATEMTNTLEAAHELEAKGYNIFEDVPTPHVAQSRSKENRWCKAIQSCLDSEAEDLGEKIEKGSETYKACKEFMDPEDLCPDL